jgi:hypothetical protein
MHCFRFSQTWIEAAVKREIGYGALQLKALQDGCASAYIRVHISAVLMIVTEYETIDGKTVPEIMDMDTIRFAKAQREYNHIVDRAVMLVLVSQAIHNDRDVVPVKKQAFFATMATIAVDDDTFADLVDSVSALAVHAGMTVASKDKLVQSISSAINDKSHRVRQLM